MIKRGKQKGFAFHCFHDSLVEYVYDYQGRVRYIQVHKAKRGQKLRLRLFQMIPDDRLPPELLAAVCAEDEIYVSFRNSAKPSAAFARVNPKYQEWQQSVVVVRETLEKYSQYFEELHEELCPNCPWDGETIFPGEPGS